MEANQNNNKANKANEPRATIVMTVDIPGLGPRQLEAAVIKKNYSEIRVFDLVEIQLPSVKDGWRFDEQHYIYNPNAKLFIIICNNWSFRRKINDLHIASRLDYLWLTYRYYFTPEHKDFRSKSGLKFKGADISRSSPELAGKKVVAKVTVNVRNEQGRQDTILDIEIYPPSEDKQPRYYMTEGPHREGVPGLRVPGTNHYLFFEDYRKKGRTKPKKGSGKQSWSLLGKSKAIEAPKEQAITGDQLAIADKALSENIISN